MPSLNPVDYGRIVRSKANELLNILKETGTIPRPDDKRELILRNDAVRLLRHEDKVGLDFKSGEYYIKGQTVQPSASPPPVQRGGIRRRTA